MQRHALPLSLFALAILACASFFTIPSHSAPHSSLRKSELLALVAGDSLPENVVFEIRARGLSFTPDDKYKSLLKDAGADPTVLAALDTAKITNEAQPATTKDSALLQSLSSAGAKIRAGQLDDATRELTAALIHGSGISEIGFVQGLVLIDLKRFQEAGLIYSIILRVNPDFPLLHTRLSFTYFESGDAEDALREAKAALAENPNNPAACLNAGLALKDLRKFDAAKSQLQACLHGKPDYELAYAGLGGLLDDMKDFDGAIAQYKKAVTLKPDDANVHYSLGVVYGNKGDFVSAIREYREVKRLDPNKLEARQNLGAALMHTDPAAAIIEFREFASFAPDWPFCHECLGDALYRTGKFEEAEKEYHIAVQLDPAEPRLHVGLGLIHEFKKEYDEALLEYRLAEKLDGTDGPAFTDAGRVLLLKKDFPAAISEFHRAEEVDPANWVNHDLRGQALEDSGDRDAAMSEYREALSIAPKELQARLDLALALEKKGDWLSALDNYRQAALDEPPPKPGLAQWIFDAQNKYESAQERFKQHLADLRSSGKASEAAALQASLRSRASTANLDDKFHAAMQASTQAIEEKRFNDAETSAKQAVDIAGKILPQDGRLPEALGQLGNVYAWRLDYKNAQDVYKQQLTQSQKLYGPKSPMIAPALQNLAMLSLAQKDFAASEAFFSRALDLHQSIYGANSSAVAETLRGLAHVYSMQRDFAKSEAALLRVVHIYEIMYPEDDSRMAIPLTSLCFVYDQWGKPDKSEPCYARLVSLTEKQFGADSPYLVRQLTAEAQALRQLGRNEEAVKLERRTQSIQSAQHTNPN
jgi:tetratricopeptide (TPR) repeat protein